MRLATKNGIHGRYITRVTNKPINVAYHFTPGSSPGFDHGFASGPGLSFSVTGDNNIKYSIVLSEADIKAIAEAREYHKEHFDAA